MVGPWLVVLGETWDPNRGTPQTIPLGDPRIQSTGTQTINLHHGNLRGPPQCHPPQEIRPS